MMLFVNCPPSKRSYEEEKEKGKGKGKGKGNTILFNHLNDTIKGY